MTFKEQAKALSRKRKEIPKTSFQDIRYTECKSPMMGVASHLENSGIQSWKHSEPHLKQLTKTKPNSGHA